MLVEKTINYKHIKLEKNRTFIDIATYGCGFGCEYCYTQGKKDKQVLLTQEQLLFSLNKTITSSYFEKGRNGSVITLCPNTEPLKSNESQKLVATILNFFMPFGNHIQIATKSLINNELISCIKRNLKYENQLILYVSIPTLSYQKEKEPFAVPISKRIENFSITKKNNIKSCLYIKPIISETTFDLESFASLINRVNPDFICSGLYVNDENNFNVLHKERTEFDKVINQSNNSNLTKFTKKLSVLSNNIVFNCSSCITAFIRGSKPEPNILQTYPELCVSCHNKCK